MTVIERTTEFVKRHPLAIVAGIGAIVLLYLYAGGSSTSSVSGSSVSGPTDAELASATQLQLAQISAGAQGAQLSAQLAGQANTVAGQVQIAGLNAQTAQYTVQQQANVQEAGIAAQQMLGESTNATQVSIADLQAQLGVAQIQAGTDANAIQAATSAQLGSYQLAAQQSSNAALVDLSLINAGGSSGQGQSLDYGASSAALLGAISSTGYTGSGLLPQVQAEANAGSPWSTISQTVQNWAARTTSSKNQPAVQTILSALNSPIVNTGYTGQLLPVS